MATGVPLGIGAGAEVLRAEVAGRPVFVERVRIAETELAPGRARSTADLFGLPPFCHHGVGDVPRPGTGAWGGSAGPVPARAQRRAAA